MRIDGAIFDLDGTLLDSSFVWDSVGEDYLRARGIEPGEDLKKRFKSMSLYQAAVYYQERYHVRESVEDIMAGVNRMVEHYYFDQVLPKKGVPEYLALLRGRGVPMCVATATDKYLVEAALKRLGLTDFFGDVFTCTGVGSGKDEPHIYNAALEFLGTPRESTWVFEDSPLAIATAKRAGFPVAAVYDGHDISFVEKPDMYISSFEEPKLK